ncbi:MAG TPA: DUF2332 family protein, partial [Gammaproteobacteria bacterium]|nr:DUF2332 family protein [Gammaproteobacteria bacterium]
MSTAERANTVRKAFAAQADYCAKLGSPFTAALCETLIDVLSADDEIGRRVLSWPGDPSPLADNVPLRLAGALNSLARSGRVRDLAAAYPPNGIPRRATFATVLRHVLASHAREIGAFLEHTPQTNEVGRSAVLIGGLLEVAARTRLPLALYEIGASAGLNLLADRYRYRLGSAEFGPSDAKLTLAPDWTGPPPSVDAKLRVSSRRGCDVSPIDVRNPAERERLQCYVWPDQPERVARLDAAIATALAAEPFTVDRADAADWVEAQLPAAAQAGAARVLFHSIVWSYLPEPTRVRIRTHMAALGASSSASKPLAWLRFELAPATDAKTEIRLTLWPGGRDYLLGDAHPHGAAVRWRG